MIPSEIRQKRVVFAVLNWGFGHVSRSIPVIDELIAMKNTVVIACNAEQKAVFLEYFPEMSFVELDGYPFQFKGNGRFISDLLSQFFRLNRFLKRELRTTEEIVMSCRADIVISDHRYGFRSNSRKSIFVTHQLNLPTKWYHLGVNAWHRNLITRFDEIWVMDNPNSEYAGKLSKNRFGFKVNYIGIYSRFNRYTIPSIKNGESVLIASGPDIYAQQLVDQFIKKEKLGSIICSDHILLTGNENRRLSRTWLEHDQIILQAKKIYSRSGYSTIMDLAILGSNYELIPTPGQYEQEYLAEIMKAKA